MDKITQQLKDLNSKFEEIVKRIDFIPEEIVETEKRIKDREWELGSILEDIEKARKERQGLLVKGGKVDGVSEKIKALWEKTDLTEDEIVGLRTRVRELRDEQIKLPKEKKMIIDEIFRISVDPLIEEINMRFEGVSETVKNIYALAEKWGISFDPNSLENFFTVSTWRSFWIIPRLARSGEEVPKDFFSSIEIAEKKQREILEKAYKKAGLLK
jgi:chromosome segregation ATPase